MKYKYMKISLGEPIENIIENFFTKNTTYRKTTFSILYKPSEYIYIYTYLIVGKVLLIKIFDKNYQIDEFLKVGNKITEEIKGKYELYYDDFEEVYLSKKYDELAVIPDFEDNILGFSFDKQYEVNREYQNNELSTYLECQNLQDIYEELYTSHTLEVNVEKREIYGQLDNYKFTFDMLTRELKSIQNLDTGDYVRK
ncbi:hypothetical protein [Fusobacterium gastrosuis]|uniref:hypothetical protein n=1 Tax=Fusobacterium gastrosuis TaxID=1755100 RepID=UPI002A95352B|nr:hypothetical protein [Fusobacterium gastrosuis]MDY5795081.1 hypothetical protein [Fusobacterium gastrosuis]